MSLLEMVRLHSRTAASSDDYEYPVRKSGMEEGAQNDRGSTYASNPIDSHRAQIARYFVKDYCLYRPRP